MIGSPLINRGLQGKSDSCAGFYREDEWVNREMAYDRSRWRRDKKQIALLPDPRGREK